MNIGDILYFSPGLKFSDVDLDGPNLPSQLRQRIVGFYVEPALACIDRGEAFAAGVLLISCIDSIARLSVDKKEVHKEDFISFVRENLLSCRLDATAKRLYYEARCGLVHEARLKNGAQFVLDVGTHVDARFDVLILDPRGLAEEVEHALDVYIEGLRSHDRTRAALAARLRKEYKKDFIAAGHPAFVGTCQ